MREIKTAEILCVGTELLLGQIINTNAAWLANKLSLLGIHSYYQTVVGDNPSRLLDALNTAAGRSDLVILTGGLGPTQDDITMAVAAQFCDRPLELHEPSRQAIAGYFQHMGRHQVTDNNWKQAMMPADALVLPNNNGTAPGAILDYLNKNGHWTTLVLLPGPPSEMRPMFTQQVEPWLQERTTTILRHLFVRLIGIGESAAETELMDLISGQQNPTLAPYASEGEVMFRITQSLKSSNDPDLTGPLLQEINRRLGRYIYEIGNRTMPEVVKDLLAAKHQTISLAESCTGGMMAAALTDLPGASKVLRGGVVAYDNAIKIGLLQVPQTLLEQHGAVSEVCALAMASGCRSVMKSDYAVAVTGIAGPDGGTADKPVGLVWLAAVGPMGQMTKKIQIGGNRARVRKVAVLNAFDLVRRLILS